MTQTLVTAAINRGIIIATAESCTGGMVAAAITGTAGSSAMFDRGFVTYSNGAKMDMLGVNAATLDAFGAVSEQVAGEMVLGAVVRSDATLAVSITGIAGPGGSDHKPEGRVCFGLHFNGETTTCTVEFGTLGRENVRESAKSKALDLLMDAAMSVPEK